MFLTALLTILVVMMLRIFLFASFSIPTRSMYPTVLPGDHVLVNKLIPGPRMDWLIIAGKENSRVQGYKAISRGDILVFNAPYKESRVIAKNFDLHYIKRCIGIPGDTLRIRDGTYTVTTAAGLASVPEQAGRIADESRLKDFKPSMFRPLGWTLSSFGPVYIPKKGEEVLLDVTNIYLYKNLIEYETGQKLSFADHTFFLGGRPCARYTFRQNHYFVAGDNAMDSEDSRVWGLLPEDHIIGKAACVWKSVHPDTGKYRFNRFFTTL